MQDNLYDVNIPAAVRLVIKEYEKEKKEAAKKKIYHNTFLLMKKYNVLKEHINDMKGDIELQVEFEDLGPGDVWILSVARSKMKSIKMISYVDQAISIVEENFRQKCIYHEYQAFYKYFIEEKTNEQIMKELNCGKNSPKKWCDNVLNELSVLLWGYEALGI